MLFSFVLAPFVIRLQSWRVPRRLAVLLAVFVGFSIKVSLGGRMVSQANRLAEELPGYQQTLREKIENLRGVAASGSGTLERASKVLRELDSELHNPARGQAIDGLRRQPNDKPIPVEIRQPDPGTLTTLVAIIQPLIQPLTTTGIVIIFVIFILMQRQDLRNRFIRLAGSQDMQRTTAALDDAGQRLSRLFLNQIIVNASFGLLIGIGLQLIGVPSAPLWGLIAMILRFVPYVGTPISAVFPLILAAAVGSGWEMLLMTAALFATLQVIVSTGGGAAGVRTQLRPLAGRHRAFGVVLDLAVGPDRAGAGDAPHGLSGGGRPPCRPPAVSRCPARQRAGADAAATGVPADAGRRSDRSVAAGAGPSSATPRWKTITTPSCWTGCAWPKLMRVSAGWTASGWTAFSPPSTKWSTTSKRTKTSWWSKPKTSSRARWRDWTPSRNCRPACRSDGSNRERCCAFPGSGKLDEAAAIILAQIMNRRGIGAAAEKADALSMSRFFSLDLSQAAAFCICYVGKPSDAMIQYTVRRLSKKSKGGRIIIALLGQRERRRDAGNARYHDSGRRFQRCRGPDR